VSLARRDLLRSRRADAAGDGIEQGKYVVVWRNVGDQWFMAWDTWNSDAPALTP
jgi:hypothetical protein